MKNLKLLFVLICTLSLSVSCGKDVPDEPVQEDGIVMLTRGGDLYEEEDGVNIDGDVNGYYPLWKCRYCFTWNFNSDNSCWKCTSNKPPTGGLKKEDDFILETWVPTGDPAGPYPNDWNVSTNYSYNALGGYVLVDITTNVYGIITLNGVTPQPDWISIAEPVNYINPSGIGEPDTDWYTLIDENGQEIEVLTALHSTPSGSPITGLSVVFQGNHQFIIRIEPNYDSLRHSLVQCFPLPDQIYNSGGTIDTSDIVISQDYSPYRLPEGPDVDDPVQPILHTGVYNAFNEYGGYVLIDINSNCDWSICFSIGVEWATFGVPDYFINPMLMPSADRPKGQDVYEYSIPEYSYANSLSGSGNFQYILVITPNYTGFTREFWFSVIKGEPEENEESDSICVTQYPISL